MSRRIFSVVLVWVLLPAVWARAGEKGFVHPGMLQSRGDLEFMKRKVLAGEQPWKDAWERLRRSPNASLNFRPKPFAHVIRGPYNRPAIGSNEISASADAAYCHAIEWYITGNKAHAAKAIEILNAWSPVLQDFQQNDAKLLAGWTARDFLNAAEILRCTDSGWEAKDIEQFRKMILGVYYPLIKDFYPEANGNWDAAMMNAMLCIGVFCDDRAIFDRAVEHYLRGHLNGGITHYVYPSGQCQESTRDQAHTQLGLGEMAMACQVAWNQGVDLYAAADSRLALGFEYTARYLLGEDVACEDVISPVRRERLWDIYQLVYQHYHFVKGMEMPYTARAVERTLGQSRTVLTLYRGAGAAPAKVEMPRPSELAGRAGAIREASARPPAGAAVVEPGQSIQGAIDGLKGKAGWVVLKRGVHTLAAPLRMASGVTLAGEGEGTTLMLEGRLAGVAIVGGEDGLHDVVLRDFVVEGAKSSRLPSDPNAWRRDRSRAGATARGGIRLVAGNGKSMRNVRLEHITVRNCTQSGVSIEGAMGVAISGCSFTDNGNAAESQHNLSLVRVDGCEVRGSRLNNSPAGDGVSIVGGRDINIVGCEVARSVGYGVRAVDSEGIRICENLIEGNEGGGVRIDGEKDGCRKVEVRENRIQNNGGYGIELIRAAEDVVQGNQLAENAREIRRQ